ncbi:MAG: DNA-binding protein [Aquabacterium sp.]|nr:DNA-binding protein [Zoogloea sp.]MCK6432238.1 DNA-binding protein [Aquabacterium sp.]
MNPNLSLDARERVFAAASQIFEESGRQTMPTVDQVRRLAKVDMHAATAAMREWRRQQTAQAAPIAVAVPEVVAKANELAIAQLWTQAQELANQSLREAQSAWDAERAELDQMRVELSDAFEAQAAELELAKSRIEALEREARETAEIAAAELQKLRDELAQVRAELGVATTRAERAEATSAELEHRVADLRGELDRAHADVDQVRAELSRAHADVDQARGELKRAVADADGLRNELAAAKAKVDAAEQAHQEHRKEAAKEAQRCAEKVLAAQKSHDAIAKEAAAARETAARLSGQLEAVQAQNAALLETLRGKVAGNG